MQTKFRQTTYELCEEKAKELIATLRADERFVAIQERAAALGLEVDTTYQHTYASTGDFARSPVADDTGRVPQGYALSIWIDFVTGGRIARCANEENPIQLSLSVTAAKYMDMLFTRRVIFLDYEEMIQNEPLFEMLEEYLDMAEEHGTSVTLFVRDEYAPEVPEGELGLLTRDEATNGHYVTFTCDEDADKALCVQADAYMPYALMVYTTTGKILGDSPMTLTIEESTALLEMLDQLPYEARRCDNFAELLVDGVGLTDLTPTPRMAQYLEGLTYLRYKDFLQDVETLADFVRALVNAEKPLTIIPEKEN